MSKIFFKTVLGLLAVAATVWPAQAALPGMKTLSGHVPAAVSQLIATGDLSGETNLQLAIGLPLRNQEALTNLLQQIYDPASPNYHHYLTPEDFAAQFGPTEEDYQKVKDFATASGFTISATHPNRVLLDVSGKASDVEKAFHVNLRTYQHPTEARKFFAPDSDPYVDASVPILHVSGLENYYKASPAFKIRPQATGGKPSLGSAPGGAYQGKDFRTAYVPGTPLTGSGQNVALFQLDGFYASDIAAYATQIGLTTVPNLVTVPVDGGVPTPTTVGNGEVSLDIEMVLSMSPGVGNIYVYEGPNFTSTSIYTIFENIFSKIADDDLAKQVGCSWFIIDGVPDPISEQLFQQMALQGQSFFEASGDFDAYTGAIQYPCDSPSVTLVGGTTLTTGPQATYASETVWNWDVEFPGQGFDGEGSSGGISPSYLIPSWQTNINTTLSGGSKTRRNVPDVALTGDNVWVDFGDGATEVVGGTSCAAPLWAGYTALINQQAAINHHAPVGFLNPALYAIANSASYANCFHDITTGNNEWSASPNEFVAVTGYDLCTGLGTPNGTNLINQLVGVANTNPFVAILSAPAPPWGSTLSVLNGSNPNGPWFLFVQDDTALNAGIVSNGWFVTLVTGNPVGNAADNEIYAAPTNLPSLLAAGSYWNVSLSVTNYGPSSSTNVSVTDTLPFPPGITLASNSVTLGSATLSGYTVTWNVGNLPINAGATMNLSFYVSADGLYTNSATVNALTDDPNPGDNTIVSIASVAPTVPPLLSGSLSGIGGHFTFNVTGSPDATTVIQASTNLVDWVQVYSGTGSFSFTDMNTTNIPFRFYRAVTEP